MSNNTANPNQQGLPPQQQQQQQQQQAHAGLIRVEQIRSLPHLTDTQKTQYETAVRGLREQLQKHKPESQEYQASLSKLTEFTNSMRNSLRRFQLQQHQLQQQREQAANGGGGGGVAGGERRPIPPTGQPRPQTQPGQGQPVPGGAVSQPAAGQLPPAIINHVRDFPFTLPPQFQAGSQDAEKWLAEAKIRYGQALHKLEVIKQRMSILQNSYQRRIDEGKPLTPEEQADLNQKRMVLQKTHADTKKYIDGFRNQQLEFQNERMQGQSRQMAAGTSGPGQGNAMEGVTAGNPNQRQQPSVGTGGPNTQPIQVPVKVEPSQMDGAVDVKEEPTPQQRGGSAEVRTASPVVGGQGHGQTTPVTTTTTTMASTSQPISTMAGTSTEATSGGGVYQSLPATTSSSNNFTSNNQPITDAMFNYDAGKGRGHPTVRQMRTPQQMNSPQGGRPQSGVNAERPQPLSQQAALQQAARSHSTHHNNNSNQNTNQPINTPPTSGFPTHGLSQAPSNSEFNSYKLVPKVLAVPQPLPMSMSAQRPTLSGGASEGTNNTLNQPAVIRPPGIATESETEGGHLLEKANLYELYREVTGEREKPDESLIAPDLEEALLDYADDFVDQLLEASSEICRARGGTELDVKDMAFILERVYNIRIPGFCSEDVRNVRKQAPTAGWTQKMAAVNTAKATGGKGDQDDADKEGGQKS
ncbi:MAG: hypothetical protein M1823_003279 [Watsoniomyces obsoletus]|nr:MAG: hypothetical protein M1823_003279 [Watsoniomyces obsoletus]